MKALQSLYFPLCASLSTKWSFLLDQTTSPVIFEFKTSLDLWYLFIKLFICIPVLNFFFFFFLLPKEEEEGAEDTKGFDRQPEHAAPFLDETVAMKGQNQDQLQPLAL